MGAPIGRRSHRTSSVIAQIRDPRGGLETCATLGMLTPDQAQELKDAGLDYYNHNLDTSPEFYGEIITTRTYQDASIRRRGARRRPQGVLRSIVGMANRQRIARACFSHSPTCQSHPESVPIISW